ncbi:MAG: nuclear transport factor 2 family protein [Solirubrobacterales bacterium]
MESAIAGPARPVRAGLLLGRALSLGNLESATACFARDGCLITPDATAIHGRERIRPLLAQLISRRTEIEIELSDAIHAGGVVLAYERWKVHSGGIDCPRVTQTWRPTLVLRQTEEDWRLAVAAPWGWAQAQA